MRDKNRLMRFSSLLVFSAILIVDSLTIKSSLLGVIASLGFVSLVSVTIGDLLYHDENLFFKCLFGLATFILILGVSGFGLMLVGNFTEFLSLAVLVGIGVFFDIIYLRTKRSQFPSLDKNSSVSQGSKSRNLYSYLVGFVFLIYVGVAFYLLLSARTGEGGSSVWLEISPSFIPVFALATLFLALVFLLSPISDGSKLILLSVHTFLAHSLFLFVWYPSRYGDPLLLLGHARYTAGTGTIYAYEWLTSHFLIGGIVSYRAQFALTIFFERMFSIDIYWVHVVLVPLLWSIFVPSFAYKIAKLVSVKRSRAFPLLTALATGIFPSLILWGTVSVPNSLGFILFFLSAVLLLKWMKDGGRWNWFVSFFAVGVAFLTHPQPGLFALVLFLWGNIVHSSLNRALKVVTLFLTLAIYPAALYFTGTSLSVSGLWVLDNFLSFQAELTSILLVFGLLGLILGMRGKYVNSKIALMLFAFYITIASEYYLTKFGMANLPFGPSRILVMGDFLLAPFVALGLLVAVNILRRTAPRGKENVSVSLSRKLKFDLDFRLIGLVLVCLLVSAQATSALYNAYPREEAVEYQPATYMIDAVRYIDADALGRYVVLNDPIFSSVAIGFLGIDYGWAGGTRGVFGMPEWEYPTVAMYWNMTKQPSISIMRQAMRVFNASVSYFVVWVEHPRFDDIVQQTSKILPVNRVFGDGKLFVFKYPLPVKEETGPAVSVVFDEGASMSYVETRLSYMFEAEINATATLSGHVSYNITEYPLHWVFLGLTVNNVSRSFDEASDINSFVYVKGLEPNDVLSVKWRLNRDYSSAVWKEDSFKKDWRNHDLYTGTLTPTIVKDGNILNISGTFAAGPYLYYYYIKPVDITTTMNQYAIVRWKSDGPIAVVSYYFEEGFRRGADIVAAGSESTEWTTTKLPLPSNVTLTYVMIGMSNLRARSVNGTLTLSVDYILICNGP